jgi:hypothetical protein
MDLSKILASESRFVNERLLETNVWPLSCRMDLPSRKRPHTAGEDTHSLPESRPHPSSGSFNTKQEAAFAYDREARQCGEDKSLNYESIKAAEEAAVQAPAEYTLVHPKRPTPRPASGFYGVSAFKDSGERWKAQVHYDGKSHHLGIFDTTHEAAIAYDRAARQCGEDKLLNYESVEAAGPKQLKPRPTSGFYGVSAWGKRWQAMVCYDSKKRYLGIFDTKQEAALTYDMAARQCRKDKPLNYESIAAAEEATAQAQAEQILVHDMQPRIHPLKTSGCMCGSTLHMRTSHRDCPLKNKQCKCGSFEHSRVSHLDCPLNSGIWGNEPRNKTAVRTEVVVCCEGW